MFRITTITLVFLALAVSAFADGWQIECVDDNNDGDYNSLAIDSGNVPHIAYYDPDWQDGYGCAMYTYRKGSTWESHLIDYEHGRAWGADISLVLDVYNSAHVSYTDRDGYQVKYAIGTNYGEDWFKSLVTLYQGEFTSIGLPQSGKVWISYYCYDFNSLICAYYEGDQDWELHTVDSGGVGWYTSLALDSHYDPSISYYDIYNNDLKYARYNGFSWNLHTVDSSGGAYTSLALDSQDRAHISYWANSSTDLKYAHWTGSTWVKETVDPDVPEGTYTSIALDSSDRPHISYYSNRHLKYAYWNGSTWVIEAVDDGVWDYPSSTTSLGLDSSGNPHISYQTGYYGKKTPGVYYAFYNEAPGDFGLESPPHGSGVSSTLTLDWHESDDGGQHNITYDLCYSIDEDFESYTAIIGLPDPNYTFIDGALADDTTYHWKVRASDGYEETWSGPDGYWSFTVNVTPKSYSLYQSRPNPATDGSASIGFAIPRACEVDLSLYDVKGRKIATLAEGTHQPGEYSATASGLSSGIYIYEMNADEFSDSKKMVVK